MARENRPARAFPPSGKSLRFYSCLSGRSIRATPTLTEDEIKELFLRAANQVIGQKEQFIAVYEQVLSRSLNTTALESELSDLEAEINIAAELIEECIKENAHVALD